MHPPLSKNSADEEHKRVDDDDNDDDIDAILLVRKILRKQTVVLPRKEWVLLRTFLVAVNTGDDCISYSIKNLAMTEKGNNGIK
jgi:hypothetical protein